MLNVKQYVTFVVWHFMDGKFARVAAPTFRSIRQKKVFAVLIDRVSSRLSEDLKIVYLTIFVL